MFEKVLNKNTKDILGPLSKVLKNKFYLGGGTALALQFGHRKSVDLDFFSKEKISSPKLKIALRRLGKLDIGSEDQDTLNAELENVRVSFFFYPYNLLFSKIKYKNIFLADWRDIACMKLTAISSRGSKKDFVDLYFILQKISLNELFRLFGQKYKGLNYNKLHLLKSIAFFEDARQEPMPSMLEKTTWPKVKTEIQKTLKRYNKRMTK